MMINNNKGYPLLSSSDLKASVLVFHSVLHSLYLILMRALGGRYYYPPLQRSNSSL